MSGQAINNLSEEERAFLLRLARESIKAAVSGLSPPQVDLSELSEALVQSRACFVTLHREGELRGCTGTLVAVEPLARAVIRTAAQTALHDPRFNPVTPEELPYLDIEISVLTPPRRVEFSDPVELPGLLRPGIDGVTLSRGFYRATFLPQVWERVPDPVVFLDMLSQKMGLGRKAWMMPDIEVEVYQVENFSEEHQSAGM